jgi:hypothetical protein
MQHSIEVNLVIFHHRIAKQLTRTGIGNAVGFFTIGRFDLQRDALPDAYILNAGCT